MSESLDDWASKPASTRGTIKAYVLLIGLVVLYFAILANGYLLASFLTATVLLSFGVIPFPRGAKAKLEDAKELARRVEELQSLYPRVMHQDWPRSQSEWNDARRWSIEERALLELKAERREKAEFPWNIPWWGRVLCCVPWLISGVFFFGDRMWGWPIWR